MCCSSGSITRLCSCWISRTRCYVIIILTFTSSRVSSPATVGPWPPLLNEQLQQISGRGGGEYIYVNREERTTIANLHSWPSSAQLIIKERGSREDGEMETKKRSGTHSEWAGELWFQKVSVGLYLSYMYGWVFILLNDRGIIKLFYQVSYCIFLNLICKYVG